MPGIITHNRILKESVYFLSSKKKIDPVSKFLNALFKSPEFMKAALFGAIGPNIFDYIPSRKKNIFGNEISYYIHNGGSHKLVQSMLKKIIEQKDKNNEWASTQRAYLYGFISHIISDTVFHPFLFYWSGFPGTFKRSEIISYRRQNLIFEYNMDLYFLHYYGNGDFKFNLEDMLPMENRKFINRLDKAVKCIILESLLDSYPEIYKKIVLKDGREGDYKFSKSYGIIDIVPSFIRFTYWLKWNKNKYIKKILDDAVRNKVLFSDFVVRYPEPRNINTHVLNLHRERWIYPGGMIGFHYESVEDMLKISCERIVDIWEKIEYKLNNGESDFTEINEKFSANALTGEENKGFDDLKEKDPVMLRF